MVLDETGTSTWLESTGSAAAVLNGYPRNGDRLAVVPAAAGTLGGGAGREVPVGPWGSATGVRRASSYILSICGSTAPRLYWSVIIFSAARPRGLNSSGFLSTFTACSANSSGLKKSASSPFSPSWIISLTGDVALPNTTAPQLMASI